MLDKKMTGLQFFVFNKMFFALPIELMRLVYEFDPTYHPVYRNAIKAFDYVCEYDNTRRYNPATGHHQYFFNNRLSSECYYNKKHQLHGPYTTYSTSTGNILLKYNYKEGKLHGPCEEFHYLTGLRRILYTYENGERVSSVCYFDD